jgi:hypothetical protein
MVALLNKTFSTTVARLDAAATRAPQPRSKLVCHWEQDASGRLCCYWDFDVDLATTTTRRNHELHDRSPID